MENKRIVQQFLTWLRGCRAAATVQSYDFALRPFLKWLEAGSLGMLDLTSDHLSKYVVHLENRGLRGSTRQIYISSLRTLWGWLYRNKRVSFAADLIPWPSDRTDSESHPFVEPEEFVAIIGTFDEFYPVELRNKLIVALLYATGVRLGELLTLDVAQMDTGRRQATIRTFKRKNHKRVIYWDEATNQLLLRWLSVRARFCDKHHVAPEALLLSLDTRQPLERLRRDAVQKMVRAARSKLKMSKRITPHSFRHGFATLGVRQGANFRYLQLMMGHAHMSTTEIYMGYENRDVEKEYRRVFGGVLPEHQGSDSMRAYVSTEDQPQPKDRRAAPQGPFLWHDRTPLRDAPADGSRNRGTGDLPDSIRSYPQEGDLTRQEYPLYNIPITVSRRPRHRSQDKDARRATQFSKR